jgi:hypothetical protein
MISALIIGRDAMISNGIASRPPKDFDAICTPEMAEQILIAQNRLAHPSNIMGPIPKLISYPRNGMKAIELELAYDGSSGWELLNIASQNTSTDVVMASIDILLALKLSHRYLKNSPSFYKTMEDIKLLRDAGAKIDGHLVEWLCRREKETLNYNHPSLNKKKSDFFDTPGVKYEYDHDSIHLVMARLEKPAYTEYMVEAADVLCSRDKFDALPLSRKLDGVVEESLVLALERSIIPFPGKKTPEEAFMYALQKVCTSISSGWFREFAWEHHNLAVEWWRLHWDIEYVDRFNTALQKGAVVSL